MSVRVFKGISTPQCLEAMFGLPGIRGIERLSFLEKEDIRGKSFHFAAHVITEDYYRNGGRPLEQAHRHAFDEINVLLSVDSCLRYEMEHDGRVEEISSPAMVYIPAGTSHRSGAIAGTGIFLCIYLDQQAEGQDAASGGPCDAEKPRPHAGP